MQHLRHLYARAAFGWWPQAPEGTVAEAVDRLFAATEQTPPLAEVTPDLSNTEDRQARLKALRELLFAQNLDWINRMADPAESALLERVSLFWHGHFACRILAGPVATQYLNTIRRYALGPFRELCLGIAQTPAMIRFLNNQQNRKNSPNENFARELLELFTIGRGHYSEQDIKEAARAFTGWTSNLRNEYVFRAGQHDYGDKTFFGQTGRWNGDDIINLVLERRETAVFLLRKIWQYFVSAPTDEGLIQELALSYYEDDYHTGRLLRRLFTSDWFYDERFRGSQIKEPVVLLVGLLRQLGARLEDDRAYLLVQRTLGQQLFNPPNVAGWPGGRTWIDNATLSQRLSLAPALLTDREIDLSYNLAPEEELLTGAGRRRLQATVNLQPYINRLGRLPADEAFQQLCTDLLPVTPRLAADKAAIMAEDTDANEQMRRLLLIAMSLPEYQLC